jgi:hypothetical protein
VNQWADEMSATHATLIPRTVVLSAMTLRRARQLVIRRIRAPHVR